MCSAAFRSAISLAQIGTLEHPPQTLVPRLFGIFAIAAANSEKYRGFELANPAGDLLRRAVVEDIPARRFLRGTERACHLSQPASFEDDGDYEGQVSQRMT